MTMVKREKQLARELKYDCDFLQVYEDTVALPSGKEGRRVVVEHVGAAAVLPITPEKEVVLVRQHRYAAGVDSLEIPAGKKDEATEDGRVCAVRELEEETGYRAKDLEPISTIYSAIGFSNEQIEIFVAQEVELLKAPPEGDEDEDIEIVRMPLDEAVQLAKSGDIQDAKTVIALLSLET